MLRVMDLFSGIGGFSYGLKQTGGFKTVAYCEIEPYCQEVLLHRMRDGWLDTAPIHTDITKLGGKPWRGRVEVITGGFPCKDISIAGKRAGIDGERSGLWREMGRIICEVRPRFAIVENVSNILTGGLERVLGDLAESGYDAEWDCLPASAFGAYHERDRIFIVANTAGVHGRSRSVLEAGRERRSLLESGRFHRMALAQRGQQANERLESEPRLDRLVHGFPDRTHRLAAIGNAIVPQIAEWIGNRILECHLQDLTRAIV